MDGIALVTGADRGIGKEVCGRLARKDCRVERTECPADMIEGHKE